jgi:hypothetical protein
MAAKWPWNLPARSGNGYIKRLEGIPSNPELVSLVKRCIDLSDSAKNDSDNFSNAEIIKNALASMPINTAKQTLIDFQKESNAPAVPLAVIRAMYSILPAPDLVKLDQAISNASLVFTDPPADAEDTPEARRFKKRMDRLRMQAEEKRYHKLTSNLDHVVDDDVTTKSMTYAASVGLNMIVAPISFGVFMYFFAAQIFSWVAGGDAEEGAYAKEKVDIKGVIAGVISGVFMLVVEMLLFVIRSHTFDKEITKKKKKKTLSPFGYSKPDAGTGESCAKEPAKKKQDTSIATLPPATHTQVDEKTKKEA